MATLGWGAILWLVGYILGIVLFFAVPTSILGWIIMPIGVLLTVLVTLRFVSPGPTTHYVVVGVVWTVIAVTCDYLFIVVAFKPPDGYYKLDVFLYYALTLAIPVTVGPLNRTRARAKASQSRFPAARSDGSPT